MAKPQTPTMSPGAAEQLLRRRLRESALTTADSDTGLPTAENGQELAESVDGATAPDHALLNNGSGHTFSSEVDGDDVRRLRSENDELRKLIEEMKLIFAQASEQETENATTIAELREHAAEFERQLAHKTEQIELFQNQIQELEQHIQQAPAVPPTENELSKMADELEKERVQFARDRDELEVERQQLRDDEQDMMRQMRTMEVQMAKERAELARQRTELQRLHSEITREFEQMQGGDRALSDRLAQLQRRHQELMNRAGAPMPAAAPVVHAAPAAPAHQESKKDSGLFRRFFGRK